MISVNKNTIIGDKSALSPGGIRIGLCALTTRGLDENNCRCVATFIDRAIKIGQDIKCIKLADFKKNINSMVDSPESEINKLREEVIHFSKHNLSKI